MAFRQHADAIPSTIDSIHRRVKEAYDDVNREAQIFTERYLMHIGETDTWMEFVEAICKREERKAKDVDTFSEFEIILARARDEPEISREPEYQQLRMVCERGKMYDYIVHSLKNTLHDAFEQKLMKYCLSFAPEAKDAEVRATHDYESKIIDWKREIVDKFEYLQTVVEEEKTYESPIATYMKNYDQVIHLMEETCKTLLEICVPMKEWVIADVHYPKKIQDEINAYNRIKLEMRDAFVQMDYRRDKLAHKAKRKHFHIGKVNQALIEQRNEKKRLRRREVTIETRYERIEIEFDQTKENLEAVVDKLRNRQSNSPRYFDLLSSAAAYYRDDLKRLDKKLETMRYQISTLKKDQVGIDKVIEKLQVELDTYVRQQDEALEKVKVMNDRVVAARKDLKKYNGKIVALKRVREIKLHSDTVKKIYHYGYSPGQLVEIKDELEEAFRLAAAEVGKDWAWLYQKLPFKPQRDHRTRTQDIEVIDLSNHRLDRGFNHLALKSMEKWRRLSTMASVPELVSTLRSMKKHDAARKIRDQLQIRTS